MNVNKELAEFIRSSPTAFHAVETVSKMLKENGFIELYESEDWNLTSGNKYFTTRNGSSLIAFTLPEKIYSFAITATHSDSPSFKIKENSELRDSCYVKLSVERYGGMLCSSWLDRPLSIAGRITVRSEKGIEVKLVDLKKPCAIIPNVAIHLNRNANDSMSYNFATDMIPLYSDIGDGCGLDSAVCDAAGVSVNELLTKDLFLYNPEKTIEWNSFISAPRLDDLQCAFASLKAFVESDNSDISKVYVLFDNEEVGSTTKQGAASTFLTDCLCRVAESAEMSKNAFMKAISQSFMVSCDNGHAIHPNHPELSDTNHSVKLNMGVVIKHNCSQKYATDGLSAGVFELICENAGVPYQHYANRADMPGGSTLGNISNSQLSLNTVDIGLAQLAMHSSYETAGIKDTEYMVEALKEFYKSKIVCEKNVNYKII